MFVYISYSLPVLTKPLFISSHSHSTGPGLPFHPPTIKYRLPVFFRGTCIRLLHSIGSYIPHVSRIHPSVIRGRHTHHTDSSHSFLSSLSFILLFQSQGLDRSETTLRSLNPTEKIKLVLNMTRNILLPNNPGVRRYGLCFERSNYKNFTFNLVQSVNEFGEVIKKK